MADSTRAMRKSIVDRDILPAFKNRRLNEISSDDLRALCNKVKARGAPATAVHVRDIVKQVYAFAILHGEKVDNPADGVGAASIATFVPKDRALSPMEIRLMNRQMESVATYPTIRLALRMILLTLVRKSELIEATWAEVDFENATWTIPKVRMKGRNPHVVYLSRQAMDIFVALHTCAAGSRFVLPSRYDADRCMSKATLNRVTQIVSERAKAAGLPLEPFTVHDLRRTGSTLLNEVGFNGDWIEKCLAHEDGRSSRSVYNKAEYAEPRRHMLQEWANMVDAWVEGGSYAPTLLPSNTVVPVLSAAV
jgi:integrase